LLTPSLIPGRHGVDEQRTLAQGKGQEGLRIANQLGRLVWFQPPNEMATNLQVQRYLGTPVLTYWKGSLDIGIGYGENVILDSSYGSVATVQAGHSLGRVHTRQSPARGFGGEAAFRNVHLLRTSGKYIAAAALDAQVTSLARHAPFQFEESQGRQGNQTASRLARGRSGGAGRRASECACTLGLSQHEVLIWAGVCQQLTVRSFLRNSAVVQHHHTIRMTHGGIAVSHQQDGSSGAVHSQLLEYARFRGWVQRRSGLI